MKLVFGLTSASSEDAVKRALKISSESWNVVEDTKLADNDKRPAYHFKAAKVSNIKHEGHEGITKFEFFNNKLMSIRFYPSDWQKYSGFMSKEIGKPLVWDGQQEAYKNSKVIFNKELTGKYYLLWQDENIYKELESWLKEYS